MKISLIKEIVDDGHEVLPPDLIKSKVDVLLAITCRILILGGFYDRE